MMGPNIEVAVATPTRGNIPQRAAQADAPPAEPFDSLLDRQAAAKAQPDGRSQKRADDFGDLDMAPTPDAKDPPAPQAAPIAPMDPAWQALLAQVLSSGQRRSSPAAPSDGVREPTSEMDAATPPPVANAADPTVDGAHHEPRGRSDAPGAVPPNAADAAFMAAALAAERKLGKDAENVVANDPSAPDAPDAPDAAASERQAQPTTDMRSPVAPPHVDSASQSARRTAAAFAGLMDSVATKAGDNGDEPRAVTVRHVDMQSHYPVTGEPMSQVASQISAHVAGDVKETAQTPAVAKDPQRLPHSGTKVLNVQLEPESLGTVNVHMKLSGDRLTIELNVAQADTLEMISRSQDSLHKSLAKDNVQIDSLTIRHIAQVDPSAAGQGASNQNPGQNGSFPQQQQAQQQGASHSGERPRGQRDADRQGKSGHDESAPARDRGAAAGGIYM